MLAISPSRRMRHKPTMAPEDSNFVLHLRTLTGPERARITGNSPGLMEALTASNDVNSGTGDGVVEAAYVGIVGWEGLVDEEGNNVPFRKGKRDRLDVLSWSVVFEAGCVILGMSKPSEDDLGNSESGSPKPQGD